VLAKEAVVGTLDASYTALAESDAAAGRRRPRKSRSIWPTSSREAFATIPANLADAMEAGPIRWDLMSAT
jgi:ferrous iron transport protein B